MNELHQSLIRLLQIFARIKLATSIEISVMKKHPAILSFLNGAYFENDEEVKDDIKVFLQIRN